MSVSEILNGVKGLENKSFDTFYQKLLALQVQRKGGTLLGEKESELLTAINLEFDHKKWERLNYLDWKMEFEALTGKEEAELLKLAEAYETYSVSRLKSLSQLALFRQISLDELINQLGIKP